MARGKLTLIKTFPYIIIVTGLVIAFAGLMLSIDHDKLIQNPSANLNCNLDPIISCGNVIKSKQGHVLGFPNPYLGLFAGGILVTSGASMLAGGKYKRWFWLGLEAGSILGIGFIVWLAYQTLYNIHNLCVYCLSVWVATITTFWYVSFMNIDQKFIHLPKQFKKTYGWVRKHHIDLLILFFILLAAFILHHFWYYYGKHL